MKHISLTVVVLMASNLAFALPQDDTGSKDAAANTEMSAVYAQQMSALAAALDEDSSTLFPQEDNTPIPPG